MQLLARARRRHRRGRITATAAGGQFKEDGTMAQLYKMVKLEEGTPVQFLAVYALRWQPEWGEPAYAFVVAGVDETTIERLRAFVQKYDAWAASPELCGRPLFDDMVETRAELRDDQVYSETP